MRHWTPEEKQRQATLIQKWQPWLKAGVKTPEGKAISKMNAYKHGGYGQEARALKEIIALCRKRYREEINSAVVY